MTSVPSPSAPAVSVPTTSGDSTVPTPLQASLKWLTTGLGSKLEGTETQGEVSFGKNGMLAITALKSPVAAGETIAVAANIKGPAGRQVRAFVMRDCSSDVETDNSSIIVDLTGAAQPIDVKHTFAKPYGCVKFALVAVGGEPIDLSISDVTFLKSRAG